MHYSSLFHAFSEWFANSISILRFTHIIQNVRLYVFLQDTGALREINFTKVGNVNLMALINDNLLCEHEYVEIILSTTDSKCPAKHLKRDTTERGVMK